MAKCDTVPANNIISKQLGMFYKMQKPIYPLSKLNESRPQFQGGPSRRSRRLTVPPQIMWTVKKGGMAFVFLLSACILARCGLNQPVLTPANPVMTSGCDPAACHSTSVGQGTEKRNENQNEKEPEVTGGDRGVGLIQRFFCPIVELPALGGLLVPAE